MKPAIHGVVADIPPPLALMFSLALASVAQGAEPPLPPASPMAACYYSAQFPKHPPLPVNPWPDLPLLKVDERHFIYDDSDVRYEEIASKASSGFPRAAGLLFQGPRTALTPSEAAQAASPSPPSRTPAPMSSSASRSSKVRPT